MIKSVAKRAVGIDYGLARIGVSLSDESKTIVSPWTTLSTAQKMEDTVQKVAMEIQKIESERECLVDEIVVGMPIHMNGRVGVLADEVQIFIQQLKEVVSSTIIAWDERLTSVQAERTLRESTMSRKERSRYVDTVASMIILQNYLDYKSQQL